MQMTPAIIGTSNNSVENQYNSAPGWIRFVFDNCQRLNHYIDVCHNRSATTKLRSRRTIMNTSEPWKNFDTASSTSIDASLEFLKTHFRESGEYHRLFDVLKMEIRKSLSLPLLHSDDDPPLDNDTQHKLEDGLLEACREVANLHFADGNLNDGWVYLQPIGDEDLAKQLIKSVEVTEDNFGSVIELAFNHGVSPLYGYGVMLKQAGTCNGITAFDVHAMQFDRKTISGLASVLLNHFHDELRANVIEHVGKVKSSVDESASLGELLQQHDWLVREGGHHIDATHLASVTRIARQTVTAADHQKALALANYGTRLGEDFQFASDPPFENLYDDSRAWFLALTGQEIESAIDHFAKKADVAKGQYHETAAAEALIDLQIRTGNRDAAVETAVNRLWGSMEPNSLPPSAFEIARTPAQFERIANAFRDHDNFAGYAFAIIRRNETDNASMA